MDRPLLVHQPHTLQRCRGALLTYPTYARVANGGSVSMLELAK